ncbi:beta-phosphoglucomutase family hydrolase [Vibrio sp. Isolate25]|uniref:beta-phosphoglucomutase family hydrolase n=1 Tax=unclassified Vibrio TaxID=2614977 RepID=UPI001EFC609A|nr:MULTISPECIES: beta-phosphoglucomutase family hydrolase [unclassified Vibrio]MCG9595820.1 beta-phosphoglucomutase family hydrolase [Vibrio sp. Isolate25]MCG9677316.1 beta-phosphoglucomutase family hydrolase [Vibrio sp. Isolate24]
MLKQLEQYQGLIFDMDGTLIDTMPAHLKAWAVTAREFGFPFTQDWLHSLGGMPSYKIATEVNKKHGLSLDPMEVSKFKMKAFAGLNDFGLPIDSTNHILNHFHGRKKIAVGTGSQRESALRLLKESQILDKLDTLVTATDVVNHKPNPDTFLKAAEQLQLTPNQCIVFEDTELGKKAAHAANMDCVMVEGAELVFYPCSAE